jgi:hypothetical protein
MTKGKMCVAALIASGLLIALSAGCKENNPVTPPPPPKPLELLYPKGGESFKVDSSIVIRWKINDSTKVVGVVIYLSLDNGITFDTLIDKSGQVSPPQDSFPWTTVAGHVSTQCIIRVWDYLDHSVMDKSGAFTVHN